MTRPCRCGRSMITAMVVVADSTEAVFAVRMFWTSLPDAVAPNLPVEPTPTAIYAAMMTARFFTVAVPEIWNQPHCEAVAACMEMATGRAWFGTVVARMAANVVPS